ncbi:hypothetical protein SVAN01_07119 [Stagonosporopsis vannaccii]|nr:hypothetical protein SVAN01_07119 [Stagonosporopsis vannaccii]
MLPDPDTSAARHSRKGILQAQRGRLSLKAQRRIRQAPNKTRCVRGPHTVRVFSTVCHCAARIGTKRLRREPWLIGTTLRPQVRGSGGGGPGVLECREAGQRERASARTEGSGIVYLHCDPKARSPQPREDNNGIRRERSAILSKSRRCVGWSSELPCGLAPANGVENRTSGRRDLPTAPPLARPSVVALSTSRPKPAQGCRSTEPCCPVVRCAALFPPPQSLLLRVVRCCPIAQPITQSTLAETPGPPAPA